LVSVSCVSGLFGTDSASVTNSSQLEFAKLQGTWLLVYQQMNGKKLPDEKAAEMFHGKMVFAGNKLRYSVELPGFDFGFVYKLDSTQQPTAIDLEMTDTPDQHDIGQKFLGIYLLEGDSLKICQSPIKRPTEFKAEAGSGNTLIVLKRKVSGLR
jgi:uncharacterized protein (TIGR03067 family)